MLEPNVLLISNDKESTRVITLDIILFLICVTRHVLFVIPLG
jgi:hypothetical protein